MRRQCPRRDDGAPPSTSRASLDRKRLVAGQIAVHGGAGDTQHLGDVGGVDALLPHTARLRGGGVVDLGPVYSCAGWQRRREAGRGRVRVVCRCPPLSLPRDGGAAIRCTRSFASTARSETMRNMKAILRTAAHANGWQVLINKRPPPTTTTTSTCCGASAEKRIEVHWAVTARCSSRGGDGPGGLHLPRSTAPAEPHGPCSSARVLSALVGSNRHVPSAPQARSSGRLQLDARPLLPAQGAAVPPMRWYARPEGDSQKLRGRPSAGFVEQGRPSGSSSAAGISR